jgi:rhodanese-related sulfurtransferase
MLREIAIIFLLTAVGTSYSLISGLAPLPWVEPELEAGEIRLADVRGLDVIWVDARSESEYTEGHIPEAILYDSANPLESMTDVLQSWLMNPRIIVVYCSDEGCGTSKEVAESLRTNIEGAEIYSLKGGWAAWTE